MDIYPSFDFPKSDPSSYLSFLQSMETLVEQILPKEILALHAQPEPFFQALSQLLPLVSWSQLQEGGNTFGVTILSNAEYSHGTGRFVSDALSRRLIPGKITELGGTRTLSFYFFPNDTREFLLNERWIIADNPEILELMRKNLPSLAQELRLTLLSISKARHLVSLRPKILEEKTSFAQEIYHLSSFEEMHGIIKRLSAEKTVTEIREYIAPFYQRRAKVFDRDIFEEIKPFVALYDEKFIGNRNMHFIARLICYHFFFKKQLKERSTKEPLARHVFLKIFRGKDFLGILLSLNLYGDTEVLKKNHLIEAIRSCIPDFEEREGSFLIDTAAEYRPLLYLEIQKKGLLSFTAQEIQHLRNKLPLELKECIQSIFNPLFMLRNDEDHFRYLIALSRELRLVSDIPQVVISFEEQTIEELSFSVILLRMLKDGSTPFKEILAKLPFKTHLRELKHIGWIRNKYPKEAAIFKVSLPKRIFLRKDRSLDLPRARQVLLGKLNLLFEEVRDYNGGLLSKQLETLHHLKQLLEHKAKEYEFPLENFFFSLEPLISQTTLNPYLLKEGFLLLLKLIETGSMYKTSCSMEGIFAGFIFSSPAAKERFLSFVESAKDAFTELSYSLTQIQNIFCIAIFLPNKDIVKQKEFEDLLLCFAESKTIN